MVGKKAGAEEEASVNSCPVRGAERVLYALGMPLGLVSPAEH